MLILAMLAHAVLVLLIALLVLVLPDQPILVTAS
jgi:hypothetical protein